MWLGCSVYDERHDDSHGRNKQQSINQVHGEGPIDHTLHPSLLGRLTSTYSEVRVLTGNAYPGLSRA